MSEHNHTNHVHVVKQNAGWKFEQQHCRHLTNLLNDFVSAGLGYTLFQRNTRLRRVCVAGCLQHFVSYCEIVVALYLNVILYSSSVALYSDTYIQHYCTTIHVHLQVTECLVKGVSCYFKTDYLSSDITYLSIGDIQRLNPLDCSHFVPLVLLLPLGYLNIDSFEKIYFERIPLNFVD